jgi:hypothetical protein
VAQYSRFAARPGAVTVRVLDPDGNLIDEYELEVEP